MRQRSEKVAYDRGKKEPRAPETMEKGGKQPELSHTGWREWPDTEVRLLAHFVVNFQDLYTIFLDLIRPNAVPAYKTLAPTAPQLAAFKEATDSDGDTKKYFLDGFKERRQAMLKLHTTHMVDREKAYRLLRSLCTAKLNALLATYAVLKWRPITHLINYHHKM
jgi:hypothetical protein